MISTVVRVQIEKDGTLKLPPRLWQELGIEPPREIELAMRIPSEKVKPTPKRLTPAERAKFDEALKFLRQSMKGVDVAEALRHVREGRKDRWF